METVFNLANEEDRQYLMTHADKINYDYDMACVKYGFSPGVEVPILTTEGYLGLLLFSDKIVAEYSAGGKYGRKYKVYYDDGTTAEYATFHLSKMAGIRFEADRKHPYDGVFVFTENGLMCEKQAYNVNDDKYSKSWTEEFACGTLSINTHINNLKKGNVCVTDNDVRGRIVINYLPEEDIYKVQIISESGIDGRLNELIKEFHIDTEKSEIITKTVNI